VKKQIEITELTEKFQTNIPDLMRIFNVPGLSLALIRDAHLLRPDVLVRAEPQMTALFPSK